MTMTDTARHVLNQACLTHDMPLDGWEHFYTGISDEGVSVFLFDRDEMSIRVEKSGNGTEVSIVRCDPS